MSIAILGLILLSHCAEIKINTQQARDADFKNYKSWCWLNNCEPSYSGPEMLYDSTVLVHIADALARQMHSMGYVKSESDADILLDFHIILEEDSATIARVQEEDLPSWDPYEEPAAYYHFLRGSLIVDITDRRHGHMIWRGQAKKLMSANPQIDPVEIEAGVSKLMRKFPSK